MLKNELSATSKNSECDQSRQYADERPSQQQLKRLNPQNI